MYRGLENAWLECDHARREFMLRCFISSRYGRSIEKLKVT